MTPTERDYAIAAIQSELNIIRKAINKMVSTEDNIEFTTSVELMLNELRDKLNALELRIASLETRVTNLENS